MPTIRIKNRATARYLQRLDGSIRNVLAKVGLAPQPAAIVLITIFCEVAKAAQKEKKDAHSLLDQIWDGTVKVELPDLASDLVDTNVEIDN